MAGRPSTTAAFWWAEALVLAGLASLALAALGSLRLCTGSLGCDGATDVRPVSLAWLALGLLALCAAPFLAARVSGRTSARRAAGLSILAGLCAFAVGAAVFDLVVGEPLLGLVPAVGALGGVAVRPASRRAVRARCIVVAGLSLAALVLAAAAGAWASLWLVLIVLPGMALAEGRN